MASPITVSYTTSGSFSAGAAGLLSYSPTTQSQVTAPDGSLLLTNIGRVALGSPAAQTQLEGETFSLQLVFNSPLGVPSPVVFIGSLHGTVGPTGNGVVQIHFNPNDAQVVNSSAGTFSLSLDNVRDLRKGTSSLVTGDISGLGSGEVFGAGTAAAIANPEPGSFFLTGLVLLAVPFLVRRRRRVTTSHTA